ncbi:MAG TPA: hypothetical protein VFB12_17305 [Ktedonobacteraceae bacterium]|nr:hypothetical protein [Ktedonobacteraceae bacterium]
MGEREKSPVYTLETPRLTEATARFLRQHRCFTIDGDIVRVHCPIGTVKTPMIGTRGRYTLTFPDSAAILIQRSEAHDLDIIEASETEIHVLRPWGAAPRYGILPCSQGDIHSDCWAVFDYNVAGSQAPIIVDHVSYIGAVNMLASNIAEELANENEASKNGTSET